MAHPCQHVCMVYSSPTQSVLGLPRVGMDLDSIGSTRCQQQRISVLPWYPLIYGARARYDSIELILPAASSDNE